MGQFSSKDILKTFAQIHWTNISHPWKRTTSKKLIPVLLQIVCMHIYKYIQKVHIVSTLLWVFQWLTWFTWQASLAAANLPTVVGPSVPMLHGVLMLGNWASKMISVEEEMGVFPKMRGKNPPKWMVEICWNNGKPYFSMDDLGVKPTIFGNTQMYEHVKLAINVESEYNSTTRKRKQWIDNRPNKQSEALFLKNVDHLKNMWWIQSSYHKNSHLSIWRRS